MKEQIKTLLEARYENHENLWTQKGEAQTFTYSDGDDIENRIHAIISSASDRSLFSMELKQAQTDWASRYHLSATRANLLRPLAKILSGSVLEIGAGCGAISRFLGELGGDVLGVEGSPRRAAIAAARCIDLPNVNIVNEVFDDFPDDVRFDAVTLIGVLEYASIFGKTADAAMTWLRKAYQSLNDGGHLIIAIENQLGLKYFAGMPEDHLAKAMFGLNDLYGKGTATTYGRVELDRMLRQVGFGSVEVALPFPDYKLPTSVVLPRGYDGSFPDFNPSAFARQSVNADAQLIHAPLFSLGQAWGVVGRNDLLGDLANSFLIVARKGSSPEGWATHGAIAYHFATERLPVYCKQVAFVPESEGMTVQKTLLAPDVYAQASRPISLELSDEAYVPGVNHGDLFERIVSAPGWQISEVAEWFSQWRAALDELLINRGAPRVTGIRTVLPAWCIDALPRNLMLTELGEPRFIDLEWGWHAGVEYGYLAYRAVTVTMTSLAAIAKPADERHMFIRYVMEDVLRDNGLQVSAGDLERYVELDGILRKLVFGRSDDFSVRDFATFQLRVMPDVTSLVIDSSRESREMAARLQHMTDDRASFEMEFAQRAQEHAQIKVELAALQRQLSDAANERTRWQHREGELLGTLEVRSREIENHVAAQLALREQLDSILASKSWRLMAPFRIARRRLNPRSIKRDVGKILRRAYLNLPISLKSKQQLKSFVFRSFAPVLKSTRAYRAWADEQTVLKGREELRRTGARVGGAVMLSAHVSAVTRDEFVNIAEVPVNSDDIDVRLIAFYLPQFHPIAENDMWWGRGFTEWTNVSKARPQFPGHHQPQLPGELGFYDLRVLDVMVRQVELARLYGVAGFCFHYYWFGGKRLLERPLDQFVASSIDFPFCICWANENWTRRWDGMDGEVLIGQSHSADDDLAFIETLAPLLKDKRYIRINGKPLVIVYRPSILPDAAATLGRWRDYCRREGIGEIFMGMVQFDVDDPRIFGFDVAIEFPPHKLARNLEPINAQIEGLNPDFRGTIIDFQDVVNRARHVEFEDFNLIRGVFPSWDNEARKPGRGYMFHGATPEKYGRWLRSSMEFARSHPVDGERIVFVNAWNEWAEGAHLEPDRRYGYAYLQATRDALLNLQTESAPSRRIVLVTHDAFAHGAQYLALHIGRELRDVFAFEVDVVVLGDGPLIENFREIGNVYSLAGLAQNGPEAQHLATVLAKDARHAIVNSTVSGLFGELLDHAGFSVVSLVHELPGVIRQYGVEAHAMALAAASRRILFPAAVVRDGFATIASVDAGKALIRPQGLFSRSRFRGMRDRVVPRNALRLKLGISPEAEIVLAVGYADHRKGVDLFVDAGLTMLRAGRRTHFVWVGHTDESLVAGLRASIEASGFTSQFHFVGLDFHTDEYYAGADIYALTSREDPFPSVVLEALSVGLPVVAFAGSGGSADVLDRGCGILIENISASDLAITLGGMLDDPDLRRRLGEAGMDLVASEFSFRRYIFDLLDAVGLPQPKVTAIVPNYNYAPLLSERLRSIDDQVQPVYELIVLDDRSTDDSLNVLAKIRSELRADFTVVVNAVNSGSVFRQWLHGVELANCDFVWIAEADDACDPTFLARVVAPMSADSSIVMSYSQSKQVDDRGDVMAADYLDYTSDVDSVLWKADYVRAGDEEIRNALAIKNTIPNVSAVVFRTDVIRKVLRDNIDEIGTFRIAGDWVAYMAVAAQGKVAYTADALNRHRRHASSVTLGSSHLPHLIEVLRAQQIARERYQVPDEQARRAWEYSERLFVSFGFRSPTMPTLDSLPDAAPFRF